MYHKQGLSHFLSNYKVGQEKPRQLIDPREMNGTLRNLPRQKPQDINHRVPIFVKPNKGLPNDMKYITDGDPTNNPHHFIHNNKYTKSPQWCGTSHCKSRGWCGTPPYSFGKSRGWCGTPPPRDTQANRDLEAFTQQFVKSHQRN